jgi:hypothetical protein
MSVFLFYYFTFPPQLHIHRTDSWPCAPTPSCACPPTAHRSSRACSAPTLSLPCARPRRSRRSIPYRIFPEFGRTPVSQPAKYTISSLNFRPARTRRGVQVTLSLASQPAYVQVGWGFLCAL